MNPYQVLGVSESATDAEVKKAYLNLARKYHPDNYHDNPLADLAQEKMKEINAAYEAVTKQRSGGGSSQSGHGQSGYGGYGGYNTSGTSSSSVLQQVRLAINSNQLSRAEALLANYHDHSAEWNFLKGVVSYRKGWMDEAKTYYKTACQMEPNNLEYRRALEHMESGTSQAYSPNGSPFGSTICVGGSPCQNMCCAYMLCQCLGCGGGMRLC